MVFFKFPLKKTNKNQPKKPVFIGWFLLPFLPWAYGGHFGEVSLGRSVGGSEGLPWDLQDLGRSLGDLGRSAGVSGRSVGAVGRSLGVQGGDLGAERGDLGTQAGHFEPQSHFMLQLDYNYNWRLWRGPLEPQRGQYGPQSG